MGAEVAPPGSEANTGGQGTTSQHPTQQTLGAPTPPDAGPFAAIEQQLRALERSANQNLAFSGSGELTAAAKGPLNQLARFLKDNPGATASISNEALTQGLPENPPADALEKRKAAVMAYVKSVDESASVRIAVGWEPAPAQPAGGTSTTPPQPSGELQVLGDVRIGTYQVGLQKQEITTDSGAPQIAVLYRSSDAFAHIIVREPDGTRKIVKVERGVDLSKPLTGADIWTKNEKGEGVKQSGAGTISLVKLSDDQKEKIEKILAKIQQKPAPAEPTPAASAREDSGAGAPRGREKDAEPKSESEGPPQGGAGRGGSTPPTGGGNRADSKPKPSGPKPPSAPHRSDPGSLLNDPAEMKQWLNTPGAIEGLRAAFPQKVDVKEGTVAIRGIAPNRVVSIDLATGKSETRQLHAVDMTKVKPGEVEDKIIDALSKARSGFLLAKKAIGTDRTQFTVEDKAAIAKWLKTDGLVPFLKKFYGDGDVRDNDKTIQFSHDGVTVTLEKGSGAVMIQKQKGALLWSELKNVTASENTTYVPKVKDQLRDLMILKGMPTR